ncbi:hypothetical protein GOP47_0021339 [Adiantum capillus-veneris]|uniref:Hexosyltransferase n=1 Tax=Adiantum capillus-veneris TaxID=13818 RepID=A0A9D4U7J3_ADICA|nr:hypothetical protein GOP47_0021339 [Adiantum capillus-veneris]
MPSRRGQQVLVRAVNVCRVPVISLLLISVAAPLLFLAGRLTNFSSTPDVDKALDGSIMTNEDVARLHALQQIESSFPTEVVKVIETTSDDSGPLSLNVKGRKDLSASWILEKSGNPNFNEVDTFQAVNSNIVEENWQALPINHISRREALDIHEREEGDIQTQAVVNAGADPNKDDPDKASRQRLRSERKERRATELTQGISGAEANLEEVVLKRRKGIDSSIFKKYNIWRQGDEDSDALVRLMKDQLIMGRVYMSLASAQGDTDLLQELNGRIREVRRTLGQANLDSELPRSASEKVKVMGQALSKAREHLYDCKLVTKKLRAMLQGSEDHTRVLNKQSAVLRQLVAKTIPKGLHCLSLWLTSEYNFLPDEEKELAGREKLEDPNFYHYALFSDNVIAAAVVINSTVYNAKEPELHVFHLVTDKLNYAAMKMWFLANPPGKATIDVQKIDDFKWLNSSYCPVLRQLQTAAAREFYFKADNPATLADASTNLKYRNPKYLSMLNHLRFYLPEVYPKLDKVLFLDDDIVVQRDLTPLWSIDLVGNVNGAVETCGESFHRFDKYLNFSNKLISENFDPNACGWAYGMNIFDLQEWRQRDMTGVYHRWQALNEQRNLWKLGTLPPGLITFYNLTYPLDKSWHVLGLGYDPNVEVEEIEVAAVIHFNGNMKPWLDLALAKYKPYWTGYLNLAHPFLQRCNIHME